jgi:peptide/nickel transport system substrate-binding protein
VAAAGGRSVALEAATPRAPPLRGPLVTALLGVIAAAVSIPVFMLARGDSGGKGPDVAGANVVVSIDPRTNAPADAVAPVGRPGAIVNGHGALWVTNVDGPTVTRIDPATMETDPIVTPAVPDVLAVGRDRIWYVSADPKRETATVGAIHPRYRTPLPTVKVRGSPYGGGDGGIGVGRGAVWVVAGRVGRVSRLHAKSQRVLEEINAGTCCPSALAFGRDAVWVADPFASAVTRIDAGTRAVTTIPVGAGPNAIAVGREGVWVTIGRDDEVARLDPATGKLRGHIRVGRGPVAVAVGGGSVWVANSRDGTVSRIDPASDRVADSIEVGESPQGIAFARGRVWVTLQSGVLAGAAEAAERRDVVRVNAETDVDSLDPALAYPELSAVTLSRAATSWQILYATCAKLVNYPDRAAPVGSRVMPEIAASLPTVSADRKTYKFTIRRGFRFSPPSNERVTAQTLKFSIERSLSPRINGPASLAVVTTATGARGTLSKLVGVEAYAAGKARHISGLVARGDRLVVNLTRPVPDLLDRLALPFFCAVPTDTPVAPAGARPIPSAGPYYVASYLPRQSIVLRRNPNYVGARPHRPREIRITIGPGKAQSVREIKAGRTDYALDGVPSDEQARLKARYGPGSAAARKNRQRYFVNPTLELWYVGLNTKRPLFADVLMRKAANHAIDRQALVALVSTFFSAAPTDQYLPSGVRGFRDARIYPSRADVAAAKQLVDKRRRRAVLYSCPLLCAQPAREVQRMLGAIGIQVKIAELSFDTLRQRLGTRGEPYDLVISAWSADYPDPAAYLEPLFGLAEIHRAGSARGGVNVSLFDDPAYQRRLAAARRLSGVRRGRADGALDVDLARAAAPMVALGTTTRQDFFSARMGCQVYHPVYGTDLAALCVRR